MDEIRGILFSTTKRKGSRSEGPEYYIKPLDDYKKRWTEVLIRKKTHLWENDPDLDRYLDKGVLIIGEIIETKHTITIDYFKINDLE
jgi:hypothetical protein